jgi:hypothetical protein
MKMKSSTFKLAMAATLVLIWCGLGLAQDVRYNFVPGTDFSKYKTYQWVRVPNQKYPGQIVDEQIKQAIDSQLALKGLTKGNGETSDLYLTYQVAIDQQTQWNAYGDIGGGGIGWRGGYYGMGMGSATATSSTINIGTLVLDFYDVKAKQQVWTGNATKQLNPSKDPAKNQKKLQKAMAKLLKNYPPTAK